MPGLLIDTNAEILNSDTLSWRVGPIKFIDSDYVMFADCGGCGETRFGPHIVWPGSSPLARIIH